MAKLKTNEQMLRALFKDLHTIEAALLRERIVTMSNATRELIASDPEPFRNPMCNERQYLSLCDKIDKHLVFENKG